MPSHKYQFSKKEMFILSKIVGQKREGMTTQRQINLMKAFIWEVRANPGVPLPEIQPILCRINDKLQLMPRVKEQMRDFVNKKLEKLHGRASDGSLTILYSVAEIARRVDCSPADLWAWGQLASKECNKVLCFEWSVDKAPPKLLEYEQAITREHGITRSVLQYLSIEGFALIFLCDPKFLSPNNKSVAGIERLEEPAVRRFSEGVRRQAAYILELDVKRNDKRAPKDTNGSAMNGGATLAFVEDGEIEFPEDLLPEEETPSKQAYLLSPDPEINAIKQRIQQQERQLRQSQAELETVEVRRALVGGQVVETAKEDSRTRLVLQLSDGRKVTAYTE